MVKHRDIRYGNVEDESLLQQIAFLFIEKGLVKETGEEEMHFYLSAYGPFSAVLYRSRIYIVDADEAKSFCEVLKGILSSKVSYPQYRWMEVIGTLFYMKKCLYPSLSDENILGIAEKKYIDAGHHEDNLMAMDIVKSVLL